ncbi:MAG: PAS domain-containing protein [Kordiimonadaceae bacterium]|nr:PAS domain-containing protein [Kordiimonadaceae bacterium]MBO6568922.1 PAS domain-containing protein [Kordiimonadaceae bacterium]MBO6965103.1 PAS domain-containing protein [Kordiimonadaceae bacterium]
MSLGLREIPDQSVEMPAFADHPDIHLLVDAWNAWRGSDLVPSRRNVNLCEISKLLNMITVFDMVSPTEFIVRYIGSSFMDLFGRDYTGANYLDLTPDAHRKVIRSKRLMAVVEQPCAAFWTAKPMFREGVSLNTVGACLPIAPTAKDAPMQMMQLMVLLEPAPFTSFVKKNEHVMIKNSDVFLAVDIGAGLPSLPVGPV